MPTTAAKRTIAILRRFEDRANYRHVERNAAPGVVYVRSIGRGRYLDMLTSDQLPRICNQILDSNRGLYGRPQLERRQLPAL
jgi:hydrogenase maturation factor